MKHVHSLNLLQLSCATSSTCWRRSVFFVDVEFGRSRSG